MMNRLKFIALIQWSSRRMPSLPLTMACVTLTAWVWAGIAMGGDLITTGPLTLSPAGSINSAPKIVSSSWGDLYAVWESGDRDNSQILFSSGTMRGWTAPTVISRPGASNNRYPALILDASGALHAAWCEDDGTTSGIVLRTLSAGAWGEARLIRERRLFHCEYPDLAAGVDNGEGLAVVWQERYGSLSTVMGAAQLPGLPDFRVTALPGEAANGDFQLYPRLLPTPREGTAYWFTIEENQMRLQAAELDLTRGEWYDVAPVLAACAPLERLPLLFPPPTGALGALWIEELMLHDQIRLEVRETCEGLAIHGEMGESLREISPAIAVSQRDRVTLAWRATDAEGSVIKLAQVNTDSMLINGVVLSSSSPAQCVGSSQPSLAVDGFGIIHVVWISDPAAGGDGALRYAYGFWDDDFLLN